MAPTRLALADHVVDWAPRAHQERLRNGRTCIRQVRLARPAESLLVVTSTREEGRSETRLVTSKTGSAAPLEGEGCAGGMTQPMSAPAQPGLRSERSSTNRCDAWSEGPRCRAWQRTSAIAGLTFPGGSGKVASAKGTR